MAEAYRASSWCGIEMLVTILQRVRDGGLAKFAPILLLKPGNNFFLLWWWLLGEVISTYSLPSETAFGGIFDSAIFEVGEPIYRISA